jgi:hypothetical protein
VIRITETFQTRQVCSRRQQTGSATIGAHHRKEDKPMEHAEAIQVQPNSHNHGADKLRRREEGNGLK